MATLAQQNVFQCDQCGTPEIVSVPILYQQGTRTFSGLFNHGVSQSVSAQAVAPPPRRRYVQPVLVWGFAIYFFLFWGGAGFRSMTQHSNSASSSQNAVAIMLLLGLACSVGLILNLRRIARYNREVYPKLHSDWAHTFMCRRCGRLFMIP
jgi:hypothetical protein